MKCKHPFMRTPEGKVRWSTKMTKEEKLDCVPFPCGVCIHCKINKRRVWTFRLLLEQRVQQHSCFITLTYNDEHLKYSYLNDKQPSVCKKDFQNYIKRLRKLSSKKIRYYAVGEYGDDTWRPHYHIALFGLSKTDCEYISSAWKINGQEIGFVHIGDLNKDSASYVAGYIIKKLTSNKDERLKGRLPEFMCSSRGKDGGIGMPYIKNLATRLNKNKYFKPQIITEMIYKGKPQPLGSYLTKKLAELTNVPEQMFEQSFEEYCNVLYGDGKQNPEDVFWEHQLKDETKMHSAEKRFELFNKRRNLNET